MGQGQVQRNRRWSHWGVQGEEPITSAQSGELLEGRDGLRPPRGLARDLCSRTWPEGLTCGPPPRSRSPSISTSSENAGRSLGSPDQQLSMMRRLQGKCGWTGYEGPHPALADPAPSPASHPLRLPPGLRHPLSLLPWGRRGGEWEPVCQPPFPCPPAATLCRCPLPPAPYPLPARPLPPHLS